LTPLSNLQLFKRLWADQERESRELRARHLQAVLVNAPWIMGASAFNALLAVWTLAPSVNLLALAIWVAALWTVCGAGAWGWWRGRQRRWREASPKLVHRATGHAIFHSLLWALLPLFAFDSLSPPQQLIVVALCAGTMAGGAFATATLPSAALGFIWTLGLGSAVAVLLSRFPLAWPLVWLFLFYAFILSQAGLTVARVFARRFESEREAARQGEVVSLLLRDFEETAADVLWETDPQGRFVQPSERLAELFQRSPGKLTQVGLLSMMASLQTEGSGGVERLRQALALGEPFRDQVVRVRLTAGEAGADTTRWWSVTAKPLFDGEGRARGWRGVISDVTAERKSHQHLSWLAHFDSLTGLANRVSVRNRLAQLVEGVGGPNGAQGRRGALMCMDLDNFKGINDSLGHSVGDAVLQEMARRLRKVMRKSDLCGRLGGDEFAVVLDDVRDDEEALQLAQRMVAALRVPVETQVATVSSGVSIGLAFVPEHGRSVDELLVAADLALYAAKAAGRGRVHVFTSELGASQKRRLDVERELRGALERGEMQVLYQPQVDIESWRIVGAEALVRWHHPKLGQVSPVEFISVAEETGLIHNIGAWVLDRACADARDLLKPLRIAVNVSASQVQRASLVNELRAQLQRHQLSPERIEVEITESLLMQNMNSALENLHAIKQLGVRIALDDFGTGYSSLAYLRMFPFDKLKIDRAFIHELMQASDARAIVRTMLELARVLGMDTLAEGVEEPAQLEVLRRVGCSGMQGFLVARPIPAQELAALMQRWDSLPRPLAEDAMPSSVQGDLVQALFRG
jgi:diguanylate cyclase (GGDEF)-like protein